MKKEQLNQKLKELYDFTSAFLDHYGYPPSIREICNKLNIKSTATAYDYLRRLEDNGLLEKQTQKNRAIKLPLKVGSNKKIPLIGVVRAGSPIFTVENLEGYCPVPNDFNIEKDSFALRVSGDSMINAGIYDRDIIIVNKQNYAYNGDIVVALIDDSATVKRFFKRDNKIILHPENDSLSDLIYDNVEILGIVKGLIRKF
ncbi:MAG: transcriptional repressor LexA [Clostridia bacterium]|nr:transcriptional repressor LexA [Clostridia bacterium]